MATRCTLGHTAARSGLAIRARAVHDLAPAVLGDDIEGVHDMRVASRRLRAALAEFGPMIHNGRKPFAQAVRKLTRDLGRARELDVMIDMLVSTRKKTAVGLLPAVAYALRQLRELRQGQRAACEEASAIAGSHGYVDMLRLLLDGVADQESCYLDYVRGRLAGRLASLVKLYKHWELTGRNADLHEVRIGFKKLRYACEVHAPHYDEPMAAFLGGLKRVQEVLGDWNDCRLLAHELRGLLARAPRAARPGLLALARTWERRANAHLGKFNKRAPRFFAKKSVRAARGLFDSPVTICCKDE